VADGKALGQAAAMPGKVAEPNAFLVSPCPLSGKEVYLEKSNALAAAQTARVNDFPAVVTPLYAAHPAPQQEIEEAHALLSKYCVGETSDGIRVPLAERITELYQWYYAAIQPPAEPDASAPQQAPAVQGQDGEQQRREKENTAFFKWWKESGHADDPTFNLTAENCAHATWQACAAQKVTASESDADEDAYVIENMGKLLAGVAVALKGPEPARKRWSYHDLPEIAAKIMLELELHRAKEAATPSPAVPPSDAPDKARMNFLVQHIVDVRKELLHGSRLMFTSQAEYDDNEEFLGTTLREQIDAAIAASQQDGRDKSNG